MMGMRGRKPPVLSWHVKPAWNPNTWKERQKERERMWERWWEGERGRVGQGRKKKSRHGNSAMYRSNHLLDPQEEKKHVSSHWVHTASEKKTQKHTVSHLNQLIWPYPSSADLSQPKSELLQRQKKDKVILSSLFTVQTAVSIVQSGRHC